MKRYQDPQWVATQALSLDHNYAMSEFVGDRGLTAAELEQMGPQLEALDQKLAQERQSGRLGFFQLPYQEQVIKEIRKVSKPILEWCWHVVILSADGSAQGARALQQALSPPQYNLFPLARRQHRPALWVADSLDPDFLYGLLDGLELRRTAFNVISKSGANAETLAQFLWVYGLMRSRVGEDRARELFIVTAGEKGPLGRLVAQEGFPALSLPPNVQGSFTVLAAAGLLPAALVGIDLEELLAGARYMDQRLQGAGPETHMAYRLAALYYLFASLGPCHLLVLRPQAVALKGLADWFCRLWTESLGKHLDRAGGSGKTGATPVSAWGVTDPHSHLQPDPGGHGEELVTFLEVGNFQHNLELPGLFPDFEDLNYLGGHSLNELFRKEQAATAFGLMKEGRPSLTLRLPEINPFTLGQLIYLLEVAAVAAAGLWGVDPARERAAAGSRDFAYSSWGRPGFETFRQEMEAAPPLLEKYTLS